jgi:penicillin-binding protein 2
MKQAGKHNNFLMGLKRFKIKRPEKEIEPNEIFLDALAQKKEQELGISEKKIEIPFSKKISFMAYVIFLIVIAVFFAQTFHLQIIKGKELSLQSSQNYILSYQIRPNRGVIYDKDFNQLVENKSSFDEIEENIIRNYIETSSFSHIIGYTGKISADEFKNNSNYSFDDYIGKMGLEKSYEGILRGEPGEFQIEKDAQGRIIKEFKKFQPESGKSLMLWLDSELQKKIEQELNNKLKNIGAQKAAAIAINPQNGGILAMVSIPNFNNNLFSHGISHEQLKAMQDDELKPFLNRVVSGQYLTGSTIKPLIACAALQEKIIEPEKNILCTGEIVIENPWFNPEEPESNVNQKEWVYHDWRTHGLTDLRKAIAQSCNIYFYIIGGGYKDFKGLGEKKIKKYLELFGWGSKTGVDIPNEQPGFIPDPQWEKEVINDDWTIGDTYHLSIGQGYLKITPLQVASAFSAIANKGTLYEPRLVQKILDFEEIKPKIIRQNFIKPEYLQIVREGMRQAITTPDMPGYILSSLPVAVAAKTGTAQTSKKDYYHHWVTIFAPYDEPEIVLTIIVEDVKGLGGVVLPVAKEVLEWYFSTP